LRREPQRNSPPSSSPPQKKISNNFHTPLDQNRGEAHFKRCLAAQLSGAPAAAAAAAAAATKCVEAALAAERASGKTEAQLEGLSAVLAELREKALELSPAAKEVEEMKGMIASALGGALGGGGGGDAFGGGAASGGGGGGGGAPVQDLGVVGRGAKRLKLEPSAAAVPAGASAGQPRSLESLMGAPVEVPAGFGGGGGSAAAAAAAAAAAPAPAAVPSAAAAVSLPSSDAPKAAAAPVPAALPAFLQPAAVAAVYGGGGGEGAAAGAAKEEEEGAEEGGK
jgi:nuclear autoantigenic sperm protein